MYRHVSGVSENFVFAGTKPDPNNRLDAVDNAFKAEIDDVGIGSIVAWPLRLSF
jgi:hypothetical protein